LAKRSPIGIRSFEVRMDNYRAGVRVGIQKYKAKEDLMKEHFGGVAKFTNMVNNAVANIADLMGINGADRGFLQAAGLRIARFAAKYYRMPEDRLAALLAAEATRELARGGYLPGSPERDLLEDALTRIVAWALRNREELYKAYSESA